MVLRGIYDKDPGCARSPIPLSAAAANLFFSLAGESFHWDIAPGADAGPLTHCPP
jgi:hypothetical protein